MPAKLRDIRSLCEVTYFTNISAKINFSTKPFQPVYQGLRQVRFIKNAQSRDTTFLIGQSQNILVPQFVGSTNTSMGSGNLCQIMSHSGLLKTYVYRMPIMSQSLFFACSKCLFTIQFCSVFAARKACISAVRIKKNIQSISYKSTFYKMFSPKNLNICFKLEQTKTVSRTQFDQVYYSLLHNNNVNRIIFLVVPGKCPSKYSGRFFKNNLPALCRRSFWQNAKYVV